MSVGIKRTLLGVVQFCAGGAGYGCLEILWRGYTHLSMLLLGGACFFVLMQIAATRLPFAAKCFAGGAFITAGEFLFGCAVNLWMGLNVWDYSMEVCQVAGQICARYALLWCVVSAIIMLLCEFGKKLQSHMTGVTVKSREADASENLKPAV